MFEGKNPLTTFVLLTTLVLRPVYLLLAAIVTGCAGASVAPQSQSASGGLRCWS